MKFTLLATAMMLSLNVSFAQITPEQIAQKTQNFHQVNPTEKLYIDFNKSSYISGETIWMKAYLTSGFFDQLSPLSRVIYLELIDKEGELVSEVKMESKSGIGEGHINLSRDIKTGNYLLRGYTQWMRNFSEEYFFQKEIEIYNVFESPKELPIALDTQITKVNFYPEGGHLVEGLQSRVAFKGYDKQNQERFFEGKLINSKNEQVTLVNCSAQGLGMLTFTPQPDETYRLVVNNDEHTLPMAQKTGQVLSLMNIPTFKTVKLQIQNNDPSVNNLLLISHNKGLPTVATRINLQNNIAVVSIGKENFPEGINTVTVFNENGIPLIERLLFIEPVTSSLKLDISCEDSIYKEREEINISLKSTLADNTPVQTYLSCSVTNDWEVALDPMEDNIISYMLLSGDLPGIINDPRQYFDRSDDFRWQKQDLLMMTHGWRKFKWDDLLSEKFNAKYPIEQGLFLSGHVEKSLSSKPAEGATITYNLQQEQLTIGKVESNENGYFEITDLYFQGEKYIILDAENKSGKNTVTIIPDTIISKPSSKTLLHQLYAEQDNEQNDDLISKSLKRQQIDASYNFEEDLVMLEGIEITADKVQEAEKVNNIFGRGDYTLETSDMASSQTYNHPLELIRNRVSGVQVVGGGLNWSVQIRGTGSLNSGTQPIILLDNVEVSLDLLSSVPPNQIRSIEVYKGASAAIFGVRGSNGALAFFTKNGEGLSVINRNSEDVKVVKLDGFQEYKEFYSPDYSVKDEKHVKPDYRSTVYWNPMITTNEIGEASVSFYSTDEPMNMTITIEGMTQNGHKVHTTKQLKVR